MKNWDRDNLVRPCLCLLRVKPRAGEPVSRQTITRLAKPSTSELIPKPVSAIEPAITPVAIPEHLRCPSSSTSPVGLDLAADLASDIEERSRSIVAFDRGV
jgi:hypothetical protein